MGIEGKLLVSRKNIVVNKESIGIDNDLTKDRNMNTFKAYCKRRKSGARFPDRKANNRLCACHCIAGNVLLYCSCYGARPVLGASAPQAAQFSFPFVLDFGASRPVCKRAPRAGERLVILSRMVTHAVTSMPKTAKVRMRSAAS